MNQRVSMRIPRVLFLSVLLVTCLTPLGRLSEVRGETNSVPTVFTNALLKEYRERNSGEILRLSDRSVMYLFKKQNDADGRYNYDPGFVWESHQLPPDEFAGCFDTNHPYSSFLEYAKSQARDGDPRGEFNVGAFLERGDYGPTNVAEALRWFRKAADGGLANAKTKLGECYREGRGITKNLVEAAKWYRKAAEQGDSYGQLMLGACYQDGCGVLKDYEEAARWMGKAADQGDPMAQDALGKLYYRGEGVEKDLAKAAKWFQKAAGQGFADSQYNYGICCLRGEGVLKDYLEAYNWFNLAAAQGDEKARQNLRLLEEKMTKDQVVEAQRKSKAEQERIEKDETDRAVRGSISR
jgi:TPR repeat protein